MSDLAKTITNLQNDSDVSERAKDKIFSSATGAREIQLMHLIYLMGRSDGIECASAITRKIVATGISR